MRAQMITPTEKSTTRVSSLHVSGRGGGGGVRMHVQANACACHRSGRPGKVANRTVGLTGEWYTGRVGHTAQVRQASTHKAVGCACPVSSAPPLPKGMCRRRVISPGVCILCRQLNSCERFRSGVARRGALNADQCHKLDHFEAILLRAPPPPTWTRPRRHLHRQRSQRPPPPQLRRAS